MIRPRTPSFLLPLLSAIAVAACAATSRPPTEATPGSGLSANDRAAVEEAERAIRRAEGELTAAQAQQTPDCPRACALVADICALAERICALAARVPPDDPVASRCNDGRSRCQRARNATTPPCTCSPAR